MRYPISFIQQNLRMAVKKAQSGRLIITSDDECKNPIAVLMPYDEFQSIQAVLKSDIARLIKFRKKHRIVQEGDLSNYGDAPSFFEGACTK